MSRSAAGIRALPNILITGTPGVGKTTLAEALVSDERGECLKAGRLEHVKLGTLIKDQRLYSEWDDDLDVPIFSEELVSDYLEPLFSDAVGGKVLDFHSAEFLPVSWFDLVVVLRADTNVLYDRLKNRGYKAAKIQENVESEIFQVVKDEVTEAYGGKLEIWEIQNNCIADLDAVVEKIFAVLGKM